MHIIFETERLILRQFTIADAALILQLNSDPEVLKYLHEPALYNITDAENIIENIILPQYERNLGRWAVLLKPGNIFLGWCGLKYRPELQETDLGYRFLRNTWGNGYATEAAVSTLHYGFNTLELDTITGRAHIENAASIKVLEKTGMEFIREETVDDCLVRTYTITKDIFSKRRK